MDEFEVELTILVYGGAAMGRLEDGRAVFVPFALPGERVLARVVEEKRGFVRAELVQVLRPAENRIQPRCKHFGVCGGCHYQHMDYSDQLAAKEAVLRDQIERIGGVANPVVQGIVPSPQAWNYRNSVQFHLSPAGKLGFQRGESNEVIEISECHLPEAALNELWPQLDLEPVPGLERVALRAGADANADLLMVLEGSTLEAPELSVEELPVSVVHRGPGGTLVLAGDEVTCPGGERAGLPRFGRVLLPGQHPPGGADGEACARAHSRLGREVGVGSVLRGGAVQRVPGRAGSGADRRGGF